MSWVDGVRHRLRSALRPGAHGRELEEEMRFHVDLGAADEQDRDAARRRFGNVTWYREEVRRFTLAGTFDVLRQDLGHAWRTVRRSPAFTAVIVLTLGLGIGANAAVFSVLDLIYLRPPSGIQQPGTLGRVWLEHFNTGDGVPFASPNVNYPLYRELAKAHGDSSTMALYTTDFALRQGTSRSAPRIRGAYVSASYFPVVGPRLERGRFFTSAEDQLGNATRVAVVTHAFARDRLGGDSALGRVIEVGRDRYTVVGILEPSFIGLDLRPIDVFMPLATLPQPTWMQGPWWESPNLYSLNPLRRRGDDAAERAFEARATALVRAYNKTTGRRPDTLMNVFAGPLLEAQGPSKPGMEMTISSRLGGVAAILLLIACANVINLLLARAVVRRREMALRLALGISRGRLVRLLTMESLLLALLASGVAALLAWLGGGALRSLIMPNVEWVHPALDPRVALFTAAVALVAGLVSGIIPALQASRPALTGALKEGARDGTRHRSRLRTSLVVVQAALSVVLLVGAALFVRSLHNVRSIDTGFDAPQLLFGRLTFDEGAAPPGPVMNESIRQIAARLEGRPGVEAVARVGMEPMQGFSMSLFYTATDSSGSFTTNHPTMVSVTPSFFRAAGISVLRGQGFSGSDTQGAPAELVVNEVLAGLLWPGRDPLGQCVRFAQRANPCYTVVGVVENTRRDQVIEDQPHPQFYVPLNNMPQAGWYGRTLVVRAAPGAVAPASGAMREELRAAFPNADVKVQPMLENLEPEYRPWRLGAQLFTGLGLLALLIAVIGIYSTVSYGVTQRTHEFGVRLALGAQPGDVIRHVLGESLRTVVIGVFAGVALALAAGKLIASMLYGVKPENVVVLGLVSVVLLAVAAVAALLPARRVSRVDPVTALRAE